MEGRRHETRLLRKELIHELGIFTQNRGSKGGLAERRYRPTKPLRKQFSEAFGVTQSDSEIVTAA